MQKAREIVPTAEPEQGPRLGAERRERILRALRRDGKVVAAELSRTLGVSEDTIRRDLRELAEAGLLKRVHGGALPLAPASPPYAVRQTIRGAAKAQIAEAAARLARDGQLILVDGGTTTLEVARRLPADLRATVVTNSPPVAAALAEHAGLEVIVLGGRLLRDSMVTVGPATLEALRMLRADLCFLGTCSLHPEVGIGVLDLDEAHVKRAMVEASAEVVAVATVDKLGAAAPYVVAPAADLTHLVTDREADDRTLAPFRALGITVLTA